VIAPPPAPTAATRPCPPLGRPLAAPYSGRITRPSILRPQRVAHSAVGRMCGLRAAHSAVLAAWIGSGCAAESAACFVDWDAVEARLRTTVVSR